LLLLLSHEKKKQRDFAAAFLLLIGCIVDTMRKSQLARFFDDDTVTPIRQGTYIEDTQRLRSNRLNELAEKQAKFREIMAHAQKKRTSVTPKGNRKQPNKGTNKVSTGPPKNPQRDLVRNIMKNLPKNRDRERISNTYTHLYKMAPSKAHRLAVIEEVKNKLRDNRLSLANRQNLWQLVRQENAKGHLGLYNRMKQNSSLYKNGNWVRK